MPSWITIAIDGHSSCGKSTLAKDVAAALGYLYIDSGAMYRAVTLFIMRKSIGEKRKYIIPGMLSEIDIQFRNNTILNRNEIFLNSECVEDRIREMDVAREVSWVSAIPEVRKKMVDLQRFLGKDKGIVMDGRDIGTVVFPDAELKIFLTASVEVRAQRRFDELKNKGMEVTLREVRQNVIDRDHIDSTRAVSPLIKADDAQMLDNSKMTRKEQLEITLKWARETIGK